MVNVHQLIILNIQRVQPEKAEYYQAIIITNKLMQKMLVMIIIP
jgi:hypothetical protein